MSNGSGVVVGVDLGTSATKVVAFTPEGRAVADAAEHYDLSVPQPGYVEQDADEIYQAAMRALRRVIDSAHLRGHEVLAIGLSSAMHGVLCVDEHGEPLGPLITWMDRRSAEIAERWRAGGTALELYARTGAPMHPMLPLCKLRWLSEHEPQTFARAARFVSVKELLVYRWFGEWLIDHGSASGTGYFDVQRRAWDVRALELARVGAERLSTPASGLTRRTGIRAAIAGTLSLVRDVPLVLCSSDGALANVGVGAVDATTMAVTLGTSAAARVVTEQPCFDERGRTFCYALDDTRYVVGGPTSSAGGVLTHLLDLLLPDVEETERFARAVELAGSVTPGAGGVTCLPFLSGERAPYWDAELRGGFLGLDLAHDRRHLLRAAMESIVFALFAVARVVEERAGSVSALLLSGGLTHASLFRELVADVFGREAWLPDQPEASAFGAAAMAAVAVGVLSDLTAVRRLVHYPERIATDAQRHARYARAFARYEAAVAATTPLVHAVLS
ncbi:gluconate kinase [bacterium]|nr:MAG: gluconate kinase [bacterium]